VGLPETTGQGPGTMPGHIREVGSVNAMTDGKGWM